MPELPEVETVRQTLKNYLINKKITDVIIYYDAIIKNIDLEEFKKSIINQSFSDIRRIGKYLLFDIGDYTLVSHLRMEGKYYIRKSLDDLTKHDHIAFKLNDGNILSYHDVRKFGTMELVYHQKENTLKSIQVLGKEINEPSLNLEYLFPFIKKAKRPIKSILLDQHIVCGLGNIYVDETLFLAKVNPKTLGENLNIYQVKKIIQSAKSVIEKAITLGGTTIRTYQSSLGVDGRFQNELNVHTLVGKKCKNCDDIILKTRVGGRGTYYCPTCQREDPMLIIGLTGGIATGKSAVSKMFNEKGIHIIDADKIYKSLLKSDKIMYNEIVKNFGEGILTKGMLDLNKLGKIIFSDDKSRLQLNSITHPKVLDVINTELAILNEAEMDMVVLDIPLLFESKMDYLTSLVVLVYTDENTQINRLISRDKISVEMAKSKINSQMSIESKKNLADIIIDNTSSLENTKKQFNLIYNNLRRN